MLRKPLKSPWKLPAIGAALIVVFLTGVSTLVKGEPERASVCASCHDDIVNDFAGTTHGRAFHFGSGGGDCTSCHGAATQHAASGETPADVVNPAKSGATVVNDACLDCHGNQPMRAYWAGSAHEENDLSCADCHAVHAKTPPRRAGEIQNQTDLCTSCHGSFNKYLLQRSHHPLREGKMECSSCHNPHGSGSPSQLLGDSPNDLCFTCHADKRGPFLWEHSPVREDCMTCHKPHGSNHEGLLVSRTVQLCQSCHMQGRHQTVAGTETAMWNTNRQCLNCHSQIHGSNHPSGPLFQR
jgi:DmsE family decaheme c-type cytochrome